MGAKKASRKAISNRCSSTPATAIAQTEILHLFRDEKTPITLTIPSADDAAAAKIQSAYRAHLIRSLFSKIQSAEREASQLQREIQKQQTVDAIRSNEKARLRMDEALMAVLLRLDSVRGIYPAVREARRMVSRKLVGLQEIVDGVCRAPAEDRGDGLWWDAAVEEIEVEVCREQGGYEMERFCAQYLGFRCLNRFLRDS